ncbi:hypothetical protein NDU88_005776 [Pleurodeles waltl]|uniref:Uncharacterized protein n=1 Tax=Pleurodeles waltl TaxID=8319 RepID=A0AAV7W8Z3_PLEWA|nr:hypothetical protein NDU88_005776 [Pleurodeles waltl]
MPRLDAVTLGLSGPLRNPRRRGRPVRGPRLSTLSALTPLRASAQHEAAASPALSGLQAPSPTAGRFRPPALSVVAGRVRALLATPSGPVPLLGPRQARRGHDFKHFLAGPSGARSSGVRHLRVLGHAPHTNTTYGECL